MSKFKSDFNIILYLKESSNNLFDFSNFIIVTKTTSLFIRTKDATGELYEKKKEFFLQN